MESRRPAARATTWAAQSLVYRSLIEPAFPGYRPGAVTQPMVEAWVAALTLENALAPATTRKAYQVLTRILGGAVDADLINRSPCRGITLPAVERREVRFLNPAEVARLADVIDPRYRAPVLVGAYGGLRVGEMGALRLSRFDRRRRVLRVEETLAEISGVLSFQPPKTRASRRTVRLPRPVAEELGAHIDALPATVERESLLFRTPEGGPLRLPSWRRRFWQPAVDRADLTGLRIHDLRHTAVALWIATATNPKQISVRAGHTSVSFTLDRSGHIVEDADDLLMNRLEALYLDHS